MYTCIYVYIYIYTHMHNYYVYIYTYSEGERRSAQPRGVRRGVEQSSANPSRAPADRYTTNIIYYTCYSLLYFIVCYLMSY